MRLAQIAFIPLVAFACTQDTFEKPEGDPFAVGEPGKADTMLSSADQKRLEQAFDDAITNAESTVRSLETEIAALEASHAAKQREANDLVARIAAREQELRDRANNNLLLCAFFPDPSLCIIANVLANDSTLRSYREQLDAARAEANRIASEIAAYGTKRDALRTKIAPLRAGKQRLVEMLQTPGEIVIPPELAGAAVAGPAFGRAKVMEELADALASEIQLLVQIRNAAVELSQVLDQSLLTLRALERSVDELVTEQRERFMEALVELLTGDPDALAERWLEEAIAAKTRELLEPLGWPMNELARFLVENHGNGGNLDELAQKILNKLLEGQTLAPVTVTANTRVAIHDLTDATSTLDMTDARTPESLEVFVDIEHSYVGDLKVSLEKDGTWFVLQDQVGGSADDLVKTFQITDLGGVPLRGRWTLHVEDVAKADTGNLRRWQLTAR